MKRTRVKICGMTQPADAAIAVAAGADAIGLVFAESSPRTVALSQARSIVQEVQGTTLRVGLFMNQSERDVGAVLNGIELDMLQFHGDEDAGFCRAFGRPYIKAVTLADTDEAGWMDRWPEARAFIVDSHIRGAPGGSGKTFDWARFPSDSVRPLLLAGGLTPDNVGIAIRAVRPWGVDVSSGVESRPGHKDPVLLKQFLEQVGRADDGA